MRPSTASRPDYGNWVSTKLIYGPLILMLISLVVSVFVPLLYLLTLAFFLCFAYFAYARFRFSPKGGDVQRQVRDLVLQHLSWDGQGQVLDIGCGSGALAIQIAIEYAQAQVTGVDHWGQAWEYSQGVCQRNAEIEGVGARVHFQQASAAALPFADGTYDVVVSNLVFHEVRTASDKRELLREALRVLRPGGIFVFQDLFLFKQIYGPVEQLVATLRGWGIDDVTFVDTSTAAFIPTALKLPFMLGTLGLLHGKKRAAS